jgi:serine protease Do
VDRIVLKEIDGSETSSEGSPADVNVKATGSGLIISSDGLIITNHHVVDNASKYIIEVNTPSGKADYKAEVVQLDKENDLAVLKIKDEAFKPFSSLKYAFKENGGIEVGSMVFTIGYPYALAGMGKEAKFADGKISAKTGYNGAINSFQSTIPVQPGNSGGPVFNEKGQLIGLISSTIKQADNVSYAVKLNYINNIIDLLNDQVLRPSDNGISMLSLEEKIKTLTGYVVLIKVK